MTKAFLLAAVSALTLTAASAQAALSVSGSVGGAPTGTIRFNFDDLTLGSGSPQTTTAVGGGPTMSVQIVSNAAVVSGNVGGQYAPPFLSGGNGAGFGPGGTNQADGADATKYLTSGSTGSIAAAAMTLALGGSYQYFGLLWGSIDDYNTLTFYQGATAVGSVTGVQAAAAASTLPNGNQGNQGTAYININSTLAFDRVVATSTQFAFEFDNVALNITPIEPVPEPGTMALIGAGLLGLGFARRRAARR